MRRRATARPLGVVLPIRKRWSDALFAGTKRVEIRRLPLRRDPPVAFVYEVPSQVVRGSLVLGEIIEVERDRLYDHLSQEEEELAAPYLARHDQDRYWLMPVSAAVEFDRWAGAAELARAWKGVQSSRYVGGTGIHDVSLIWCHLAGRAHDEPTLLSLEAIEPARERDIDERLVGDVAPFYAELERGFVRTHVPSVGVELRSTGFSTLGKMAFAIVDGGGAGVSSVVGKVVLTAKRGRSLKIGPIWVDPGKRQQRHAGRIIERVVQRARQLRLTQVYGTVPRGNSWAQRLFRSSGFAHVGTLSRHYSVAGDEDIFGIDAGDAEEEPPGPRGFPASSLLAGFADFVEETFFPVDERWRSWLAAEPPTTLGDFIEKPHEMMSAGDASALVIYKRGGTAKVIPTIREGQVPAELVRAWEQAARLHERHKLSVFLGERVEPPAGYALEVVLRGYSRYGPIRVYSSQG